MLASTKFKFVLVIAVLAGFTSCRKENSQPIFGGSNEEISAKVTRWLATQAKHASGDRASEISKLKSSLELNKLWIEKCDNNKLVIVPVSSSGEPVNAQRNAGKYFILILDARGEPVKGSVLKFDAGLDRAELRTGTLSGIFQHEANIQDGKYSVNSIWNDFRYQLTFTGGKLKSVSEKRRGRSNALSAILTCIDWYLVTTIYYTDGTTETYEEYLETTCGNPGEPQEIQPDQGGGNNDIEYEYEKRRYPNWVVYDWGIGDGQVWSREFIKGKQVTGSPQGGQLVTIQHLSSECNKFSGVYSESSHSTSLSSNLASVYVAGYWYPTNAPLPSQVAGSKSWTYNQAFP